MRWLAAIWLGTAGCAPSLDADGDGTPAGADCDDTDPTVFPGALELCDGLDNDCDGLDDEDDPDLLPITGPLWYVDHDGDGHGDERSGERMCGGRPGWVDNGDDCDDSDALVYPGAPEICDGLDSDCDVTTSEAGLWWFDGTSWSDRTEEATKAPGARLEGRGHARLAVCAGTWSAHVVVEGDLTVTSRAGPGQTVLDGGDADWVIDVRGAGATRSAARVQGLTLRGAAGGVVAEHADVVVEDVVIVGQRPPSALPGEEDERGDGIRHADGELVVHGVQIHDAVVGSGISTAQSTAVIVESTLHDLDGRRGAAVSATDAELELQRVQISACRAAEAGGALWLERSVASVWDVRITDGSAPLGGAVAIDRGRALLADVELLRNTATLGGALHVSGETTSLALLGAELANNRATVGGAIHAEGPVSLQLDRSAIVAHLDEVGAIVVDATAWGVPSLTASDCDLGAPEGSRDNVPFDVVERGPEIVQHTLGYADTLCVGPLCGAAYSGQ